MGVEKFFLKDTKSRLLEPRITSFFEEASIYVPNKFVVVFYGEYINKALEQMEDDLDRVSDITLRSIYKRNYENWRTNHVDSDENGFYVELKWTCKSVNIPSSIAETEDGQLNLDTTKSIRYPLIKTHKTVQSLPIRIVEDRNLMMYQFFNALVNQFFVAGALKPRSSFHKLNIVIAALIQNGESKDKFGPDRVIPVSTQDEQDIRSVTRELVERTSRNLKTRDIHSIPGQVFIFNSAVMTNLDTINLTNANNSPLEYGVTFQVPNTFQNSFNIKISGIRNDVSDIELLDSKTNNYNLSKLEIKEVDLGSEASKAFGVSFTPTQPISQTRTPEPVPGIPKTTKTT